MTTSEEEPVTQHALDPDATAFATRRVTLRDRIITIVAGLLTRAFFRSVEVEGSPPPPGPVVLAASHLYGFVDPVLLVAELGILPRFLAKATLWDTAVARPLLGFARVIPVHRRADGASGDDNASMFADAVAALEGGSMLALFPEGTTHDDPSIRPLRTGAARIAIQAAGSGVQGVSIVPVGVTYEDKVAVRGRAIVSYGTPIEVPSGALLGPDGEPLHEQVRELTDHLQREIQALTPHFDTTEEALALGAAATMTLHEERAAQTAVPLAEVNSTARRLALVEPAQRNALVSLVARYRMLLGFVGIDDVDVQRGISLTALARKIAVIAVVVTFLSPVALAGLLANIVPVALVLIAGLIPKAPVSKGTIRVLVAAVAFPATWLTLAFADARPGTFGDLLRSVTLPVETLLGSAHHDRLGAVANLVVLVAVPLMGVLAMFVVERIRVLVDTIVRWRTFLDRRGQMDEVRERRREVVELTRRMLEQAS